MAEREVSIIKIRNVLLATIPASPSDRTIDSLQDSILTRMTEVHPQGVIMDISLVDIVDSFFARTIEETAEMISLMGGETIVAGIQPAVAVTAMELGLGFGQVETALNVEIALDALSESNSSSPPDQKSCAK